MEKRAQLKIQEMAFMLVALVFFFILVGLFALSIFYSNLYEEANRIAEQRTLTSINHLADSPELNCGSFKSNCVDSDKLLALTKNEDYETFWPFSSLKLVKSTAFEKNYDEMIECTFANYPECEIFIVYDKKVEDERVISNFVALCRKDFADGYSYERCEIAKLVAGTEIRIAGE